MGGACCKPTPCCKGADEPLEADECMIGCICLNGSFQLGAIMFFTFVGSLFSLASLGDCAFVKSSVELPFDSDSGLPARSRHFGFITFEKDFDGTCYWYDEGRDPEAQIRAYFEFLGSDWQIHRIFLAGVSSAAWLVFMYTFTFCCTTQVKGIRFLLGMICFLGLTLFQSLSFLIVNSSFCRTNGCIISRSAYFGIAAACCYFVGGILYCCTSDYPGNARIASTKKGIEEDEQGPAVITASKDDDVEIGEEVEEEPEMDVEAPDEDPEVVAAAEEPEPEPEEEPEPVEAAAVVIGDEDKQPATEEEIVEEEVIEEDTDDLEEGKVAAVESPSEENAADEAPPAESVPAESAPEESAPVEKSSTKSTPSTAPFDEEIEPTFTTEHDA